MSTKLFLSPSSSWPGLCDVISNEPVAAPTQVHHISIWTRDRLLAVKKLNCRYKKAALRIIWDDFRVRMSYIYCFRSESGVVKWKLMFVNLSLNKKNLLHKELFPLRVRQGAAAWNPEAGLFPHIFFRKIRFLNKFHVLLSYKC